MTQNHFKLNTNGSGLQLTHPANRVTSLSRTLRASALVAAARCESLGLRLRSGEATESDVAAAMDRLKSLRAEVDALGSAMDEAVRIAARDAGEPGEPGGEDGLSDDEIHAGRGFVLLSIAAVGIGGVLYIGQLIERVWMS